MLLHMRVVVLDKHGIRPFSVIRHLLYLQLQSNIISASHSVHRFARQATKKLTNGESQETPGPGTIFLIPALVNLYAASDHYKPTWHDWHAPWRSFCCDIGGTKFCHIELMNEVNANAGKGGACQEYDWAFTLRAVWMDGASRDARMCVQLNRRLGLSRWFQRNGGADHLLVASHCTHWLAHCSISSGVQIAFRLHAVSLVRWPPSTHAHVFRPRPAVAWVHLDGNTRWPNIYKCSQINFERYKATSAISLPGLYIGKQCTTPAARRTRLRSIAPPKGAGFHFIGDIGINIKHSPWACLPDMRTGGITRCSES